MRVVKSDNFTLSHGSVNPLNRNFGYFSRPLLEEQNPSPYNNMGGGLYD